MTCVLGDKDSCNLPWQVVSCALDAEKDHDLPPVELTGPVNPSATDVTITWTGVLATDTLQLLITKKNVHSPTILDETSDEALGAPGSYAVTEALTVGDVYNFFFRRMRDGIVGKWQREAIVYYGVDITYIIDDGDSAYIIDDVTEDFIIDDI